MTRSASLLSPTSLISKWKSQGWPKGTPGIAGPDEGVLARFDAAVARGKYMFIDSFQGFRCGTEVFARKYAHDYGQIYGKEAKTKDR